MHWRKRLSGKECPCRQQFKGYSPILLYFIRICNYQAIAIAACPSQHFGNTFFHLPAQDDRGHPAVSSHSSNAASVIPSQDALASQTHLPNTSSTAKKWAHRHVLAVTPDYDPDMDAPGKWEMSFSRCNGCLMPMRYVGGSEAKKEHLLNCKGWELHIDTNGICRDGKNCRIRDVSHWGSTFHWVYHLKVFSHQWKCVLIWQFYIFKILKSKCKKNIFANFYVMICVNRVISAFTVCNVLTLRRC